MMDGLPRESTASIVQDGLDHGAQSLFSAVGGGVPLPSVDELKRLVTSPGVKAILEARIEQVVKHGHTSDNDDALPLKVLPSNARSIILNGLDLLGGERRNLRVAKLRFARGAAMLLAAIDQLDRVVAAQRSEDERDGA